jgi:hypothetical protein
MIFSTLLEKIRNPLRKQELARTGGNIDYRKVKTPTADDWKNKVIQGEGLNDEESIIRAKYTALHKVFPDRAEKWLDNLAFDKGLGILRTKLDPSVRKLYEKYGVQVFVDKYATGKYAPTSYEYRVFIYAFNNFLSSITGLLPNKKPKIIITNKYQNPLFKAYTKDTPIALYYDRMIYVDEYAAEDPESYIHEYAHYLADLIPKQSEPMLEKAYNDMLDFYWRRAKKKRYDVSAKLRSKEEEAIADKWRKRISTKLGIPEYGLTNKDEFFAVLIQKWNTLPNNMATYRYKQTVKTLLSRL